MWVTQEKKVEVGRGTEKVGGHNDNVYEVKAVKIELGHGGTSRGG